MNPILIPVLLLAAAVDPDGVRITKGETTLDLTAGPDLVARYQFAGTVQVDKGAGTKPLAKPYFWPLLAPGQVPVTRDWPMKRGATGETTDHFHQKSVWFCHGDVMPEGVESRAATDKRVKGVDFWSESANHGRIVCTAVGEPKQVEPRHASISTTNEWRSADGTKLLDESRTVHLIALPMDAGLDRSERKDLSKTVLATKKPVGYLIVLDIDLTAAVPVTFGDTKEGSMGVRVPDSFSLQAKDGGTVTSSTGKTASAPAKDDLPLWGEIADWNDYSGTVGGKPAGLAVFADPNNPVPSAWHTRAYGLMAANPFGRSVSGFPSQKGKTDLVRLAKGEHLKLRFGVYAHAGDAKAGQVAEAFKAFAEGK